MNDRVTIDIQNGVADVRLVRVDKMNALDDAMFEALAGAGERLKIEPGAARRGLVRRRPRVLRRARHGQFRPHGRAAERRPL